MSEKEYIDCITHGKTEPTLVCCHLLEKGKTQAIGFYQADLDPNNREWCDLNAWCGQCDAVLEKECEWNDVSEAFADFKLICRECYDAIYQAQLALDASLVEVDDDNEDNAFWDCADAFITLANQHAKEASVRDVGLAFLYAAARYHSFMITKSKIEKDEQKVIEHICKNFRAMLIENIEEYKSFLKENKTMAK